MFGRSTSAADSDEVDRAILRAASADYLDLWFVSCVVADVLRTHEDSRVREATLDAVERLLRAKRLRAGALRPPGEFEPWPLDVTSAVTRIRREYAQLDRRLGVGDVAWFEAPE
jgi:hypothetical protein